MATIVTNQGYYPDIVSLLNYFDKQFEQDIDQMSEQDVFKLLNRFSILKNGPLQSSRLLKMIIEIIDSNLKECAENMSDWFIVEYMLKMTKMNNEQRRGMDTQHVFVEIMHRLNNDLDN